ncbi:MAG TPA: hypothetical protein PKD24_12870 [Pyrinomonadaceae bacterium]|nr:hypothetical protein [Pyrinomonadaceae bacterium]HMP65627.1 hypothetical protein [Pyrinomonadaceae bacterium]
MSNNRSKQGSGDVWARPEMQVTFRAEIMPGKTREERTFRIKTVHSNGRVSLYDFPDQHRQASFEPIVFRRTRASKPDQRS